MTIIVAFAAIDPLGFTINLMTLFALILALEIAELARELHDGGWSITNATVEATRCRLRSIIITFFGFTLGVVPLIKAGGAIRGAIGTMVFGGMIASTLLAIPFVPVSYFITQEFCERETTVR